MFRGIVCAMSAVALLALSGCGLVGKGPGPHKGSSADMAEKSRFGAIENARAGTRYWQVRRVGRQDEIEGYADRVSVLPGESFRLFVSTMARGYRVEAFRMGWYHGDQARRVW